MPYIKIVNLFTEGNDGMVQPMVTASNDSQVAQQDFYTFPEKLRSFATKLQNFPKYLDDFVSFEYGDSPTMYSYILIKAIVVNSRGHSAIEIKMDNRLETPLKSSCNFFMKAQPANINELGKQLFQWTTNMEEEFRFEWDFIE